MSDLSRIMEAEAMRKATADPIQGAYWTGRLHGARRVHHGPEFDAELHGRRLASVWSPDEMEAAQGRGYREALGVTLEEMPPHAEEVRMVCSRIGSASQIAAALRLGNGGPRRIRAWIGGENAVSYATWRALRELAGIPVEPWPTIRPRGAGHPPAA